jgi:pimeloyl-ACP methyl ester carboxylesterase
MAIPYVRATSNFCLQLTEPHTQDKPNDVESYTMISHANDVKSLLDHLKLDQVVLVGHDWASGTAYRFALRWPERVKALITYVWIR